MEASQSGQVNADEGTNESRSHETPQGQHDQRLGHRAVRQDRQRPGAERRRDLDLPPQHGRGVHPV